MTISKTDIVARLRGITWMGSDSLCHQAADEIERLRLVVRETVDDTHRESVEQHAVDREGLGEPAVEAVRVHVLHDACLGDRVVCAVLLPWAWSGCVPFQCRTHRSPSNDRSLPT